MSLPSLTTARELDLRYALARGLDDAGFDTADIRVMALLDAIVALPEAQEAPRALVADLMVALAEAGWRLNSRSQEC